MIRFCLAIILFFSLASAQKPNIQVNGVKNAASLLDAASYGVAPRSLATIFGDHLAATTAVAPGSSLPTTLGGTVVEVNGIAAPLLYVSPGQINFQVPSALKDLANAKPAVVQLVVRTADGTSDPAPMPLLTRGFGIFTQDSSGGGQGAVVNIHRDGSFSANTPNDSFDPKSDTGLLAYGTGFGDTPGSLPDGTAGSAMLAGSLAVFVGSNGALARRQQFRVDSFTTSADTAGVDVLVLGNVFGGADFAPQGCKVPLWITEFSTSTSRQVAISIHNGGGPCVDPPAAGLAEIEWQRSVVSGVTGVVETDSVLVRVTSGAGNDFTAIPTACSVNGASTASGAPYQAHVCAGVHEPPSPPEPFFYPRALDPGVITVQGPGFGPVTVPTVVENGQTVFRLDLSAGSVHGGDYRVTGSGGKDVGAFDTTVHLPVPVQLTNTLTPGTVLSGLAYTLTWTGGDKQSWLVGEFTNLATQAALPVPVGALGGESGAESGNLLLTLPLLFPAMKPVLFPPGDDLRFHLIQIPAAAQIQTFAAPGLTLGGRHVFKYESFFSGLKSQ